MCDPPAKFVYGGLVQQCSGRIALVVVLVAVIIDKIGGEERLKFLTDAGDLHRKQAFKNLCSSA